MSPLALLARSRVRGYLHAWSAATPRQRGIGVLLFLASIGLFVALTVGGSLLFDAVRAGAGARALAAFVERTFLGLGAFLLAGSLPFVAGAFFSGDDLPLAATFPLSPRVLALVRLAEACVSASAQFVVLGLPLALAGFLALRPMPLALCLSPIWAISVLAIPPLAASALLLAMARRIGVRRVRGAVAFLSAILAVGACCFAISETAILTGARDWKVALVASAQQLAHGGRMVEALAGRLGLAPLVGIALVALALPGSLALVCGSLGGRVLVGDALLEGSNSAPRASSRIMAALLAIVPTKPSVRAILEKDLLYVARDLTLLSQLGVPVILYLVPFLLAPQARRIGAGSTELLGLSAFAVAFIAYMVCSILGLSSIGLEGRGFWILRASPITVWQIVVAKWWLAFLPSSGLTLVLGGVAGILFGAPPIVWVAAPIVLLFGCAALCGIEVGVAGLFPRFEFENPAHRASVSALIWGFVWASAYALFALGLLVVAVYGVVQAPERVASWLIAGGGGAFLLLSFTAAFVPLKLAAARIHRYVES